MKGSCSVFGYRQILISIFVCVLIAPAVSASPTAKVDAFMGDWEGHGRAGDGEEFRFVAQPGRGRGTHEGHLCRAKWEILD